MNSMFPNPNTNKICEPLKTIPEVLKYSSIETKVQGPIITFDHTFVIKNAVHDCHTVGSRIQRRDKLHRSKVPKTLVCHDFKGGYLEDKYENGIEVGNGYTFYRWQNIDIFVYFSHNLVTIPPPGWTKCAHRNGVKILGTIITEWKDGKKLCDEIFQSEDSYKTFTKALVNICIYHAFDGYLVNIENKIDNPEMLVNFVKHLSDELHRIDPNFTVLWYDSVTKQGNLKWQNELNDLNKCYFDVCDGIFLNYNWTEQKLKNSYVNAGERYLDVFVGVDVFGRGVYGGGGFFTHMAAHMVRKHNLSMALFAQGWTHETLKVEAGEDFFEKYLRRDNTFWLKLHPYLYTHPITGYGFDTSFYIGADKIKYNLNLQELALSRPAHCGKHDVIFNRYLEFCDCIQIYDEGYFPHTFSYKLTKYKLDKSTDHVIKLFVCNIDVVHTLNISTFTKELDNVKASLDLVILAKSLSGKYFNIYGSNNAKYSDYKNSFNIQPISGIQEKEFDASLSEAENKNLWTRSKYKFHFQTPMKLLEIGGILNGEFILLGRVKIDAFS